MKKLALALAVLCLSAACFAQDQPVNIYAAGVSYNNAASPAIAGTGLYARSVNDGTGTYAFTVVDALPNTVKPFTVTTNVGAGFAQKVASVGSIPLYVPTSAGISWTGTNTGWQWTTGVLASIPVKKGSPWRIMPNMRLLKSSVSNGTGYQVVGGFLFAWGK